MERHLSVPGMRLVVRCDAPELVRPFFKIFGDLSGIPSWPSPTQDVQVRIDAAGGFLDDGIHRHRLASGPLRPAHVYNLLYRTLVRRIQGVFLLHAAAVEQAGRAWLIGGPSGAGKTSLACGLLRRGYGFLGDDLAPLAVADGRIYPFPRRLGLLRDAAGEEQRGAAVEMADKRFLSSAVMGARLVSEPLSPGAVVLINPYLEREGPVRMSVGLEGDPGTVLEALAGVDGLEVRRSEPAAGITVLDLILSGGLAIATAEEVVHRADHQVLFHSRGYGSRKEYAEVPSLVPLSTRHAALELLRETLNREPSSALMIRHEGRIARVLFELMGLLEGVPCYRLTAAGVEDTCDLLASRFG
ncbi:MAG: hypothetical protein ACE5HD_07425 [Acidobacteriota bacterium]